MKINNKFRIVLSLLCLVLIAGSLAVLFPAATETECEHPRAYFVSSKFAETDETNVYARRTEYRCDECGEILVQSNTLDDFSNNLPAVQDSKPVYSGCWSVGYISAVTGVYKPFNAQADATGWLCMAEDVADIWKADSHGAFRFSNGLAPSFGLSSRTNDKISVCYTAPKDGSVSVDFTKMRLASGVGNLLFDILCNGKSYLNGGIELFSSDFDTLEELNTFVEGMRISVSQGDEICFTFKAVSGAAILDGTFVSPRVEYVDTPFTVMVCKGGCTYTANGVCKNCGSLAWNVRDELQRISVVASDGTSRYASLSYYEGMTWKDAVAFLSQDAASGYVLYTEQNEMYNRVCFVYEDVSYAVCMNGVAVHATDKIIPGARYTVDLPAV